MRVLKEIKAIKLMNLKYNYKDFEFDKNTNEKVVNISMSYGLDENIKKSKKGFFAALVEFKFHFSSIQVEENGELDSDKVDNEDLNGVYLNYEIIFTSDTDFSFDAYNNEEELNSALDNLRQEIISVIEPYCRNKVQTLLTESKRKVPDIPFISSEVN